MKQNGFTLIELAITIMLFSVLVPATYVFLRTFQAQYGSATTKMQTATGVRALSEELRRDLRTHELTHADDTSWVLEPRSGAACERIVYELAQSALVRRGCDVERAVVTDVTSLEYTDGSIYVHAQHRERPERVTPILFELGLVEAK